MAADPMDLLEVDTCLQIMTQTFEDIQILDAQLYTELVNDPAAPPDAFDAELERTQRLKKVYLKKKTKAEKLLRGDDDRSSNASFGTAVSTQPGTQQHQQQQLRLPKIELPKFGGDLKKWLGWWSQFSQIHKDDHISTTNKFHYLLQHLEPNSEAYQMVARFPPTGEHYKSATEALEERYGRQDLLLQVYLRELLLLVISNATSKDKIPLTKLHVQLDSHLRALKELKLSETGPDTWLLPLVESSLSEATLRAWQRSDLAKIEPNNANPLNKSRLDLLMEFIQSEVRCEQQISLAQSGFQVKEEPSPKKKHTNNNRRVRFAEEQEDGGTAAGLFSGTKSNDKATCVFCDKPHHSDRCITAQKMTLEERRKIVERKRLCFICLSGKHIAKKCSAPVKCIICSRKHYPIMCPGKESEPKREGSNMVGVTNTEEEDYSSSSYQANTSLQCNKEILLNTFIVELEGNSGRGMKVRIVADSGSQRSWIKKKVVESSCSKLVGQELIQCCLFGGNVTQSMKHGRYSVILKHPQTGKAVNLELLEKSQICSNIPKIPEGPWIKELANKGILLSDVGKGHADIDILIGSDYWGMIQTGRVVKLNGGLIATETVLGWTLSGPIGDKIGTTYLNMLTTTQDLNQLWSLEALGIRDPIEQKSVEEEEQEALKIFASTVTREDDGRYCVALPWKMDPTDLPTNYNICEKRLTSTTNKLIKQDKVGDYNGVIQNWDDQAIISKLIDDDKLGHYLSHHPVFKDSFTTPVRPVFNASLKLGRSPSLNNCLFTGPNLIELLIAVVLRFREKKIGISSDIAKAFLQILIRLLDRNFLKFLWWEEPGNPNSRIIIFIHNRVVFGMNCSPFLLLAVIITHINNSKESAEFKEKLIRAFYVDNNASKRRHDRRLRIVPNQGD